MGLLTVIGGVPRSVARDGGHGVARGGCGCQSRMPPATARVKQSLRKKWRPALAARVATRGGRPRGGRAGPGQANGGRGRALPGRAARRRPAAASAGRRRWSRAPPARAEHVLRVRRGVPVDLVDQGPDGGHRHRGHRLPHGGQRRVGEGHQRRVVVADHRQVARHAQAALPGRPDRAERHQVGAADDAGDARARAAGRRPPRRPPRRTGTARPARPARRRRRRPAASWRPGSRPPCAAPARTGPGR